VRDEHRAGRSPEQLARRVLRVAADDVEKPLLQLERRSEPVGDDEHARFAEQQRGNPTADLFGEVGIGRVARRQRRRDVGPVARELDGTATLEPSERPDHAGRAEVERRGLLRLLELVHRVRRPERLRIECRLRIRGDRRDRAAYRRLVPLALGERLVRVGDEEHAAHGGKHTAAFIAV
jgi:hypothetical protein